MQGELFDGDHYDDLRVEAMGERPSMTAEEWMQVADQMHDERNWEAMDEALRKHDRAVERGQVLGQISLSSF